MSIKVMSDVWENYDGSSTSKLVLLAMADFANDEGKCWPSYNTLARKSGIGRRHARRVIAGLIEEGWVERERRERQDGSHTSNVYRVRHPGDKMSPPRDVGAPPQGQEDPVGVGTGTPRHEPSCTEPSPNGAPTSSSSSDQADPREMFSAIVTACGYDLATITASQRGKVNQTEKIMRGAGATPEEIAEFRRYWDKHDWRGEKGEPPEPHHIREEWGRFKNWTKRSHILPGFTEITTYE